MRFLDRVLMAFEGIGMAVDAIRTNKVRAGLTIAGVAIGVFVVVAMGATVNGIQRSFQADLDEFGATSFQVRRRGIGINSCDGSDESCPDRRNPGITLEEWRAIRGMPEVETATAWLSGQTTFDYRDRHVTNVGYDAQSPDWIKTDVADISRGAAFRWPNTMRRHRWWSSTIRSRTGSLATPTPLANRLRSKGSSSR